MDCSECGSELEEERNYLTDEEWTTLISCPECDFELETESNLVYQERQRRIRNETRPSL